MGRSVPLTALLSQILVAFTIEFDNEAEHRLPHRTTMHGKTGSFAVSSPWLVSMAMWFNCIQHLDNGPIPLPELERRARTPTNLHGMQRWGYISVTNEPGAPPSRRPQSRRATSLVQATRGGEVARRIWAPLFAVIEERWRDRFGSIEIDALRSAALPIVQKLDPQLPDCMPILGYGLTSRQLNKPTPRRSTNPPEDNAQLLDELPLPALLSKPLLAFAVEFENEAPISLAICANVIRVLTSEGVRVRDLPALSGVSKESIAMAFGILRKARLVVIGKEPGKRPWQIARLTERGIVVQKRYSLLLAEIEQRWESRFGKQAVHRLRQATTTLVGDLPDSNSLLFQSIEPYADGWRAAGPRRSVLPHFPMVLHRGGYPDGS
jgi:hypothetical protein